MLCHVYNETSANTVAQNRYTISKYYIQYIEVLIYDNKGEGLTTDRLQQWSWIINRPGREYLHQDRMRDTPIASLTAR